jgi:NADPH-dependent glutamate synthase beta subunit-like oxidoreductase
MLKRVVLMGAGWLLMSLVLAGMTVPLAINPAEAARLKLRFGSTAADAVHGASVARRAKKAVESETPNPVRMLNTDERQRAAQERADAKLRETGELKDIGGATLISTSESQTAVVNTGITPSIGKTRDLGNGIVCMAGCN